MGEEKEIELKPCPMCGSPEETEIDGNELTFVFCSNTECLLYDIHGTTLREWNDRTGR